MGGMVASHACIRMSPQVKGLLLFSAMIDVQRTPMMKLLEVASPVANALIPKTPMVNAVRVEELSQDEAVQQSFIKVLTAEGYCCSRRASLVL